MSFRFLWLQINFNLVTLNRSRFQTCPEKELIFSPSHKNTKKMALGEPRLPISHFSRISNSDFKAWDIKRIITQPLNFFFALRKHVTLRKMRVKDNVRMVRRTCNLRENPKWKVISFNNLKRERKSSLCLKFKIAVLDFKRLAYVNAFSDET